jgi:hypothetical protein
MKQNFIFVLLILAIGFIACKSDSSKEAQSDQSEVYQKALDTILAPGDTVRERPQPQKNDRPNIPADQLGMKGVGNNDSLKTGLAFIFGQTWTTKLQVLAGQNDFTKLPPDTYIFKEEGTYTFTHDGKATNGVWKARIYNDKPTLVMVPDDKKMKTIEFQFNHIEKAKMVWAGTSTYGDNAIQMMLTYGDDKKTK